MVLTMEKQMIIRIDMELKDRLSRLARAEGKTSSQIVRELIRDYVKDRDIAAYIDGLWTRIGAKLAARGVRPPDINKAIAESRKKRG
jgi:predicted transcriptional regulator